MSLLARIVAQKRAEVAAAPRCHPEERSDEGPHGGRGSGCTVGSFASLRMTAEALSRPAGAPLRLIAEVKFASPSAGPLSRKLDAGARALAYASAGASMVSVLCDETFFGGSWGDLALARTALDRAGLAVPLLAKEFIVDPLQLEWARASGADAALLIVRLVDRESLRALSERARELGLEPFVEVATEAERDLALEAGARIVGVNARDLDTLAMDPERVARVLSGIPGDRVAVHLSGIGSAVAVRAVAKGRADAALVGEALMRADDPAPLLREFVSAAGEG
jgi:indole-3-glycerol phosphate synthase